MSKRSPKKSVLKSNLHRFGEKGGWPMIWEAWPLLFLLWLGTYWGWASCADEVEAPVEGAVALVDRTPPKAPVWKKPPKGVEDVLKDLRRGDCWTASARLRGLRKAHEESRELRVLEGEAFVCAGDGPAAASAIEPLLDTDFRGDALWVAANAALLRGSITDAQRYLQRMIDRDADRRRDAEALMRRISSL